MSQLNSTPDGPRSKSKAVVVDYLQIARRRLVVRCFEGVRVCTRTNGERDHYDYECVCGAPQFRCGGHF